jgi:hypothetical protein
VGALSSDLRGWIVPGRAGVLAVVDGQGLPRIARVWAARVLHDSDVIEIHVQRASALPVLQALEEAPRRGALNLIDVPTYRSRAFKGACVISTGALDPAFSEASLAAQGRAFHSVGLPADGVDRMLAHADKPRAMAAVRLTVESVFDQSPKPGAGARL